MKVQLTNKPMKTEESMAWSAQAPKMGCYECGKMCDEDSMVWNKTDDAMICDDCERLEDAGDVDKLKYDILYS